MSLSVAGTLVQETTPLSPVARLALTFVDGGIQWLTWATADTAARYAFDDETTLAAQVQQGLHASRLALLPRLALKVGPAKLMSLGLPDLLVLARAERGEDSPDLRRVLVAHGLLTCADLDAGPAFLATLGVAGDALFHAADFDDSLALHQLACEPAPAVAEAAALQKEAAAFAVQQARTPPEFCDYYRVYLLRAATLPPDAAPQQRADAAWHAMDALLPALFPTLDCPQVDRSPPAPEDVGLAIGNWLMRGRQVGFARVSLGLQLVLRHTAWRDETGPAARQIVRLYADAAQAFLAANRPRPREGLLGQDGASCLFEIAAGNLRAQLHVSGGGVVSLRDFGRQAAPALSPVLPPEFLA
jgi:hypothetical protein